MERPYAYSIDMQRILWTDTIRLLHLKTIPVSAFRIHCSNGQYPYLRNLLILRLWWLYIQVVAYHREDFDKF